MPTARGRRCGTKTISFDAAFPGRRTSESPARAARRFIASLTSPAARVRCTLGFGGAPGFRLVTGSVVRPAALLEDETVQPRRRAVAGRHRLPGPPGFPPRRAAGPRQAARALQGEQAVHLP